MCLCTASFPRNDNNTHRPGGGARMPPSGQALVRAGFVYRAALCYAGATRVCRGARADGRAGRCVARVAGLGRPSQGEGAMVTNWVQRCGSDRDVERRTRQIKEIIRLGTALQPEQGLDVILGQVVEAISATLSFQVAVLNLVHPDHEHVEVVATAGLTEAERQRLVKSPPQVARLLAVMRPGVCISHSYFISPPFKHPVYGGESGTPFTPPPPPPPAPPHPL